MLLAETGKPLIQHAYEGVKGFKSKHMFVATEDVEIDHAVKAFDGNCVMTYTHDSGTSRVIEAVRTLNLQDDDIVINVQGDCILKPEQGEKYLNWIVSTLSHDEPLLPQIATLAYLDSDSDHTNPNMVKVVMDCDDEAMYFSRAPIPYNAESRWIHSGIYGFKYSTLKEIQRLGPPLEYSAAYEENLEQLHWMEEGLSIKCIVSEKFPSIDTREDYELFKDAYSSW